MKRFRPLLVMGTRPEAIKMAPVVAACRDRVEAIQPLVCFTGQHSFLRADVRNDLLSRLDHAAGQAGKSQRGTHHLNEVAAA